MQILLNSRWIDASGTKKTMFIAWAALATALTLTLALAWNRELSGGRIEVAMMVATLFFATFIVGFYHIGIFQVTRASETGRLVQNRSRRKIVGSLLLVIGLFCLWVANSSNVFYFSSRDDALKTDIEKLTSAFDGLEKSGNKYFDAVGRTFKTNAETLETNVWNEMTGSARAGIGPSTQDKIMHFNAYVGLPVQPQTVDIPWNDPRLMAESKKIKSQMEDARNKEEETIKNLHKDFKDEFTRNDVAEMRAWLSSQRDFLKKSGVAPEDNPASVAKLRDGFRLFADIRARFDSISKDPAMGVRNWTDKTIQVGQKQLPDASQVNKLSPTPLSSDMRMVGRLFMGAFVSGDWKSLFDLGGGKLVFAMIMSALFEIGVGFLFWLLIQKK